MNNGFVLRRRKWVRSAPEKVGSFCAGESGFVLRRRKWVRSAPEKVGSFCAPRSLSLPKFEHVGWCRGTRPTIFRTAKMVGLVPRHHLTGRVGLFCTTQVGSFCAPRVGSFRRGVPGVPSSVEGWRRRIDLGWVFGSGDIAARSRVVRGGGGGVRQPLAEYYLLWRPRLTVFVSAGPRISIGIGRRRSPAEEVRRDEVARAQRGMRGSRSSVGRALLPAIRRSQGGQQ